MNILGIEHKTLLLTAMLFTSGMVSAQVVVKGTLYGGGKGIYSDQETGLVTGNTKVIMNGGIVERSLYGGGELGSVGTFTEFYDVATGAHVAGEPKTCATGTGKAEVLIRGGQVGIDEAVMPDAGSTTYEDDMGYVFCGSRGEADSLTYPLANLYAVVKETHLEISGSALITASAYGGCENGIVMGDTHVEIAGGQIGTGYDRTSQVHDGRYDEEKWNTVIEKIKNGTFTEADASGFHECDHWPYGDANGNYYTYDIYAEEAGYDSHGGALNATDGHTFYGNVFGGGSGYYPFWDEENNKAVWRRSAGRVWGNTVVDITGGHILTNVYGGNEQTDVMGTSTINMTGGTLGVPRTLAQIAAHPVTCYLFGAGKGDQRVMFNRWTNVQNAEVNIGGDAFFFGSVFGGGEDGHVLGDVTVNINNLASGANNAYIGTWGYSYVDGNVFGGGRGFSGEGITCGSVGGDITVNINGGNILGSIYGGGRMASAGIGFALELDPIIGYFQPDIPDDPETPEDESETHGHVTINISGGTIGNDYESKLHLGNPDLEGGRTHGGNVFGGSMGRLTKLDGSINPKWPVLGQVKTTEINIEGDNTIIKGNVYGGGEFGLVLDSTEVNVRGGTIWRNVYGGGYGSNDNTTITDIQTGQAGVTFRYTPMAFAGVVSKKTFVNISGGWVKKNVYGGGEMASVGLIDYRLNNAGTDFENITKHDNEASSFALSWPYDYQYFTGFDGNTHVEITGGRIGITGKDFMGPWNASGTPLVIPEGGTEYVAYDGSDAHKKALKAARQDNGDVYGGGHGIAGDRYDLAFCANANNTVVSVDITSDANPTTYKPNDWVYGFLPKANDWTNYGTLACIAGSVYGGAENGHVLNTANLTLNKGLIGHAIYGGGKGKDTYTVSLLNLGSTTEYHNAEIYSLTAGKVYGSTSVTMNGGYVMRNVYGGGNMASVGKGNYAGGSDDYSTAGYGEKVANLWTGGEGSDAWHFLNSGKATVNIVGGTVGTAGGEKDDLPTGNVFGGCRGESAPNIPNTPRYQYAPSFFSGYVNMTDVTIGRLAEGTEGQEGYVAASGPLIYGSVYGGGQDGHVRRSTNVTVNYGEIGLAYNADNIANVGAEDENGNPVTSTHFKWLLRGNVTGSGSGIGKYEYDLPDSDPTLNYDGIIDEDHTFIYTYNGRTITLSEKDYSNSSGSVTDSTSVVINGGTIYRNIYGGGSLAMVGPPYIPGTINPDEELGKPSHWSKNIVEVKSGTVGESAGVVAGYGGHVFGAGRGVETVDIEKFSTSVQTQVTIGSETTHDALVYGNVYGGGEVGQVSDDTEANVVSGQVGTIDYTDANNDGTFDGVTHTTGGKVFGGGKGLASVVEAARVKGNSNVNISGGHVLFNVYGGGEMASVGLREQYTYTTGEGNEQTEHTDYRPKLDDHNQPTGLAKVTVTGGQVGPAPREGEGYNIPIGLNGVDGYVFGGGMGIGDDATSRYAEFADVNYGSVKVEIPSDADITTNRIWGSIFGGAEDGHVLGSDTVRLVSGLIGTTGTTSYDGNIFGGGRNYSKRNYTAGRTRGNITVEMKGGQLYGSIFGGGRLALTGIDVNGNVIPDGEGENGVKFGSVKVMVKGGKVGNGDMVQNWTASSMGDVFGGGKGDRVGLPAPHPAASVLLISLTKNTEVEISQENDDEPTRIYGSVYGGGEMANVGHYTWDLTGNADNPVTNIQLTENTGITNVTVSGGIIGADNMFMEALLDENLNPVHNFDIGHVFGGGEGFVDNPDDYEKVDGISILDYMTTVGTTNVTISDDAFVKGSVYGGGLNGHVEKNASVLVTGGQIGFGQAADGTDLPMYTSWPNPLTTVITDADTLAECPHWPYGLIPTGETSPVYNPYDPVMVHNRILPSDGKSWFGNVFGGGSGYYPYITYDESTHEYTSHWDRTAGRVKGNTSVEITGGHILTCVYGGCEITDVGLEDAENETHVSGGLSTVTITGGTVGVPRTLASIAKHPVTCYVFGGGKGDPRTDFNTWTNVWDTQVTIGGNALIYGSVFGGGEEGHVIHNANVTVNSADVIIGTTGTSYVDGNIFGGGRGFSGEAITAGVVGGDINVNVSAGNIFGSVYGGGRLASVGTHFTDPTNPLYGQFVEDTNDEEPKTFGHVTVDISGGIIGNRFEYAYADPNATSEQMATWQAEHLMPYTEFDADNNNHLIHTKGGNVYGASMGRLTKIDGTTINPFWPSLGKVKQTTVVVRDNAVVKSSVYGGGEFGTVRDNATVRIQGGTVGTKIANPDYDPENPGDAEEQYHFGSVYGGGFGSPDLEYTGAYANDSTANGLYKRPVEIAGRVYGNTFVYIEGGQVLENVFGGGELASIGMVKNGAMVNGVATVEMTGGQVGPLDMTGLNAYVYGGSQGIPDHDYKAYCNVNSTSLTVDMDFYDDEHDTGDRVWGSLFGGGSDGHVLGDALVLMRQGTLGTTGVTSWDGNIFGGGRNYSAVSETSGRVGGNVEVTVTGGHLLGSVFGGGRLGSVGIDEDGEMQEDAGANTYGYTTVNIGSNDDQNEIIIGHPIYDEQHPDERVGGNVYGGGKGIAGPPSSIYPRLAKVKQTEVNIREKSGEETWIEGSVFGSGEDGHVLQNTYVNIFDGQIGGLEYTTDIEALTPCTNFYHGNVYGGGRGVETYTGSDGQQHYSLTAGHVGQNTFVNIYGGRIVRSVYGGGNLSSVGVAELETTGLATVNVLGGSVGFIDETSGDPNPNYAYRDYGNVFGSGHGMVGNDGYETYKQLAYVKNTHVTIDSIAMIYGSVFGGGEDGHVRENTLVDVKGGVIGQQDEDFLHGNVYGGGRGIVRNDGYISPTAGEVFGHATVNIMQSERKNSQGKYYTPLIWNNVYGGGSRSVVSTYKVVNMSAGTVHDHVFGGSRDIPSTRTNKAPRWVNMWGGTIEGNLYGCSHNSNDDVVDGEPGQWASFINLSGGTIKGDVFGAGYGGDPEGIINHEELGGLVNGSVGILIGKNAIQSAFDGDIVEIGNADSLVYRPNNVIPSDSLNIFGNVYAGADDVIDNYWGDHAVSGYSNIYIDGTGYDSEHNVGSTNNPYIYIGSAGGGIYGSGNNCEAGEAGHNILVREYGTRNPNGNPEGEFTQASRSLTTIQRGGTVVLENTNMNLSGASDISFPNVNRKFGVVKVSDGLYVANASGIVLGSGAQNDSVMIDSVKLVKSVYLPTGTTSAYSNMGAQATWDLVGIQGNTTVAASLYRLTNNGTTPVLLSTAQENVIIFKDKSKLRVRYKDEADGIKKYGQLEGFFRMRGDAYDPYDITESFAYARPKTASFPGVADDNVSDGGFLSYNIQYNYFTDEGAQYTKTNQHPYRHPYLGYRADHQYQEYRLWVDIPKHPKQWYVDGTRGWGHDDKSKKGDHAGIYPDTPKKTIFGVRTYDAETNPEGDYGGIVTERFDPEGNPPVPSHDRYLNFLYSEDIIYVVGALTEFDNAILRDSITGTEPNEIHHPNYPLRLFRYPGGHKMSNGQYDNGAGGYTPNEHPYTVWGAGDGNVGPGANYGAMLNVKADSTITMKGVVMDGLYGNPLLEPDSTAHMILPPNNTYGVTNLYNPAAVIEPLVITNDNSTLSVGDSTVLMRGFNNTNAEVWYIDPFADRDAVGIQGGAMYVDTTATVNVSGKVYITDNKQYLKIGDADAKVINSNVYLPTFDKHLYITNTLFEGSDAESASKIGITSPMGNAEESYVDNTFSPVAVADKSGASSEENHDIASDAWENCNFLDDQGWFFVNKNYSDRDHQRTTYYDEFVTSGGHANPTNANLNDSTVFFGWTWANIVRSNPGGNSYQDDGLTVRIKDAKGLAWLISMTSGMNGVGASSTDFTGVDRKIKQTADVDLLQYVWVPIGSPAEGYNKSFAGNYDGQGHLIKNLYIEYIGIGDSIYERHDYGLFGYAFKGEVYRTFVVSGEINPVIANANLFNVGGLVGRLDIGKVSNSEAAVALVCPDESQLGYFAGGLIGSVQSSMVHSSMAMPSITVNDIVVDMPNESQPVHTMVGGLIGSSTATSSAEIRNSFVNALYDLKGTPEVGGLLGNNDHTVVRNCYVNWHGGTPASSVFKGVVKQAGTGSDIDYCYVKQGVTVENFGSSCGSNCFNYTPTTNADQLGYMYYDNLIEGDTTLMARLNINAKEMNRVANDSIYSYWARPGLAEINGDLPVLLLNEFDVFVTEGNTSKRICHQGNFRSLSTYAGGVALQYGGPVRDDDELKSALVREQDGSNKDCLFIYGDVRSVGADFEVAQITQDKVSIHEDVSIIDPGKLTEFANTYVGISFDNSCGQATSTPGVNYGLLGMGGYLLPRDWHMFSSPLSNAPLGFKYGEDNEDNEPDGPSNNPWVSVPDEFNWLSQVGSDECNPDAGYRYWMNTFDENNQSTDGYFPTRRGNLFEGHLNELFIVGDDECLSENNNRYPYGMDFYTWNEPQYHWINFKRNGPNHWHSDEPHNHLTYVTEVSTNHSQAETDINESKLISSKGYMAAITKETFMQSHGYLNNDSQSIMLTNTSSSKLPGWNLVGNPFHGYLDFNQIVSVEDNLDALSTQYYDSPMESVFYVVYNADKYEHDNAGTAFRYYPVNGSRCGEYAERYLHPHQGFYVKAKATDTLLFNKDMLVTRQTIDDNGAESHFRDERPAYPLVNLYLSSDQGCADVTVIEFERPNWGGATKLKELRVGDGLFYAQHDDTHYAALFAQQGIDRVPLWFEAKEDDIFTIKWNTANGDFHSMYLIDNIAGVQYDMIRNNSYTFEGHKGDYPSRFLIVFNVTDVEENIELNSFVFFDGSQWMVTGEGQLEFIDMNGQVLWVKNVDGGQSRVTVPEVASGMYLFRLTNGKETKVQKVIVNR